MQEYKINNDAGIYIFLSQIGMIKNEVVTRFCVIQF